MKVDKDVKRAMYKHFVPPEPSEKLDYNVVLMQAIEVTKDIPQKIFFNICLEY